jgi:hypothetical protein
MIMAEFEIVSEKSELKCVVFVVKDNYGNLKWRKDQKTYSGALRIGGTKGQWAYNDWSGVLALFKKGMKTPILVMAHVPSTFLECGETAKGTVGSILLPDSLTEKDRINWEISGVYC